MIPFTPQSPYPVQGCSACAGVEGRGWPGWVVPALILAPIFVGAVWIATRP